MVEVFITCEQMQFLKHDKQSLFPLIFAWDRIKYHAYEWFGSTIAHPCKAFLAEWQ